MEKRLNREQFDALSRKQQKAYVKKVYPDIRKELIEQYWDDDNGYDCGGIRNTVHHCYEKGSGGAIPLWHYIDKRNMILWSLKVHFDYHNTSKIKWTKAMKAEALKADLIKEEIRANG